MSRSREGAGAGLLRGFYLLGLPSLLISQLQHLPAQRFPALAIGVVAVPFAIWITLVIELGREIARQLAGRTSVASRGAVWLASVVVALISMVVPSGASTRSSPVTVPASTYIVRPGDSLWEIAGAELGDARRWPELIDANRHGAHGAELIANPRMLRPGWRLMVPNETSASVGSSRVSLVAGVPGGAQGRAGGPQSRPEHSLEPSSHVAHLSSMWPAGTLGALPLALMAKRRQDVLRQSRIALDDGDVDAAIDELRSLNPDTLEVARTIIGDQSQGVVRIENREVIGATPTHGESPVVVAVVAADRDSVTLAFARPGFALPASRLSGRPSSWNLVALGNGRCVLAETAEGVLRSLALRQSLDDIVVFLGNAGDLDDEVAARCVTIEIVPNRDTASSEPVAPWRFRAPSQVDPVTDHEPEPHVTTATPVGSVRVELLRAEPTVEGLAEPFLATLRRRCVEMTAYLAVHRGEPVTGERLRARVLGRGDDASVRTLSNTASAVRRSLGSDDGGPRLRPVSPAGLYRVHGVECDVLELHELVESARRPDATNVAGKLQQALELVRGEPLATALRGFEWFLAEGHLARLLRDGEWAALRLADEARIEGDYELAFWAIERGRLLDPYSEVLEAALHRVPRLREFGGDRPGGAQHEAVGTR